MSAPDSPKALIAASTHPSPTTSPGAAKLQPTFTDYPDLQLEYGGEFKWQVRGYTRLRELALEDPEHHAKLYSPEFLVNDEPWRILMFPAGNSPDQISLFLEYSHGRTLSQNEETANWHKCVQLSLRMCNCADPLVFVHKETHHRYSSDEIDWGFSSFMRIPQLTIPIDGHKRPILEDDGFDVYAYLRVYKDDVGTLWHTFNNWDSKKETGYVGLKNQGATCYMNSLLQSLYFTNFFRRAVFQIPTEGEVPHKSVALALQRVFYNLQHSLGPVDTRELTKSFGWDTLDAFMQHDVQEFNRVLQDNLETKMKGTVAEGSIEKTFVGKMKSYIKCVNVDYESAREETFYDIQLNVKGMKNLYDSFKDYVAVEMLDGENKYQSEKFGLQDAKKGVIFTSYPPVLHLQLKRFEYDFQRDAMVKINDRHEYPDEIDLSEFLESPSSKSVPQIYELHGVLVHSGDVNGGHYCAFIRPREDSWWLKFDDDRVIPVTEKEVYEDNFGDSSQALPMPQDGTPPMQMRRIQMIKRFTNAYMLVYIRKNEVREMLREVTVTETPAHLAQNLHKEQEAKEKLARDAAEKHLFINVKVLQDKDIIKYSGFDLIAWGEGDVEISIKVKKDMLWKEFHNMVATQMGRSAQSIQFWNFYRRQNKTIRPEGPIPYDKHVGDTVEAVYRKFSLSFPELRLYVETADHQVQDSMGKVAYFPDLGLDNIVIFVKYYDIVTKKLEYVGNLRVKKSFKGNDLVPLLNDMKKLQPNTAIRIFEEIKVAMVPALKMKSTLKDMDLVSGDILCFQKDVAKDVENKPFALVTSFYEDLQWRADIQFRPKEVLKHSTEGSFTLSLSKRMLYDDMVREVATRIKADHEKIRLLVNASGGDVPKQYVKMVDGQTLHEVMQTNYYTATNPIFWYEVNDLTVKELENKTAISFIIVDEFGKEGDVVETLVLKTANIKDFVKQVAEKIPAHSKLEFFETVDSKAIRRLNDQEPISNLGGYSRQLYATNFISAYFPKQNDTKTEKLITVFHFARESYRTHSVPFGMILSKSFTVADIKSRLQSRMAMSEKDFSKIKVAVVGANTHVRYLEDDEEYLFDSWKDTDFLGLDHVDKNAAKKSHTFEKAIKIHG